MKRLLAAALLVVGTSAPRATAAPLAPAWVFPAEGRIGAIHSSPTVYNNVVYIGTDDARLYALQATGPEAGRLATGFPVTLDGTVKGRPAVYGRAGQERVYVATTAGSLYSFRLDGTPAWSQSLAPGTPIYSTPAVRGGHVFVTASNGRIYRRNVTDGGDAGGLTYGRAVSTTLARSHRVPLIRNYLEVRDATPFFRAGRVRVLSPGPLGDTMTVDYTYRGKNTRTTPHRLLNVVPVGVGGPAVTHPAGSRVSGFGPGAAANTSPAVPGGDDSTLVITALQSAGPPLSGAEFGGRNLVGLRSEGMGLVPQWEMSYGARITSAPVVDHATGRMYFGTWNDEEDPARGGRLYCVHAANGQPADWGDQGAIPVPNGVLQAGPWLERAAGTLFFGTTNGALHAVNTRDGAAVFPPTMLDGKAGRFMETPLVVRDRLYIGSHSGRFYSVSVANPEDFSVYAGPEGEALDTSPSTSGSELGHDVVVIGSSAGRVLAFPVQ